MLYTLLSKRILLDAINIYHVKYEIQNLEASTLIELVFYSLVWKKNSVLHYN